MDTNAMVSITEASRHLQAQTTLRMEWTLYAKCDILNTNYKTDHKVGDIKMSDNEFLLAISDMMDKKLQPINERLKRIELTQENEILPRLQTIESCYTDTYKRYQSGIAQIEAMQIDIDVMKSVIREHSEKLQKIS